VGGGGGEGNREGGGVRVEGVGEWGGDGGGLEGGEWGEGESRRVDRGGGG